MWIWFAFLHSPCQKSSCAQQDRDGENHDLGTTLAVLMLSVSQSRAPTAPWGLYSDTKRAAEGGGGVCCHEESLGQGVTQTCVWLYTCVHVCARAPLQCLSPLCHRGFNKVASLSLPHHVGPSSPELLHVS